MKGEVSGCKPLDTDTPPQFVSGTLPLYPVGELLDGRVGTVVLDFTVNADGTITLQTPPAAERIDWFRRHVEIATRDWVIKPAMKNRRPVATTCQIVFNFRPPDRERLPLPVEAMPRLKPRSPACQALGRLLPAVAMAYPAAAQSRQQEGWVVVEYDVEDNTVVRPRVAGASPKGFFEEAALAWVRHARHESGGAATGCTVVYQFKLQ